MFPGRTSRVSRNPDARSRSIFIVLLLCAGSAQAQTTLSTIAGRVYDRESFEGIGGASVSCVFQGNGSEWHTRTDRFGYYSLPLLSPGMYRVRAQAADHQAQEVYNQELFVGSRLKLEFGLRPGRGSYGQETNRIAPTGTDRIVHVFGEDMSRLVLPVELVQGESRPLTASLSYVIPPEAIDRLPLSGRDVYTTLVLQPGVTADTTTSRGLGYSVNGQRPTASNFLLDGIENNNYLVTGPLLTVAPEAVQEYRVSVSNFSAEYGRTSGLLANAVTQQGANEWHGLLYFYGQNEALNARDKSPNDNPPMNGLPAPNTGRRTPIKSLQPGLRVGGPLIRKVLFGSVAAEYFRFRSAGQPAIFFLPTADYRNFTPAGSPARTLLDLFPAPRPPSNGQATGRLELAPPSSIDRWMVVPRVDFVSPGGTHRLMVRAVAARTSRPDFQWSPYKDFTTPLTDKTNGVAVALTSSFNAHIATDLRAGWNLDDLRFDRPWPDIPSLSSGDLTALPGSPLFYGFRNRSRTLELNGNAIFTLGAHTLRIGGGYVGRRIEGYLSVGRDAYFGFRDFGAFAAGTPESFYRTLERATPYTPVVPRFDREYRSGDFSGYLADTVLIRRSLALNFGVRFERYGAPRNVGAVKDDLVQLGTGNTIQERIRTAQVIRTKAGDEALYDDQPLALAPRFGFAWSKPKSRVVVRGGYGLYFERPFENLWLDIRNNNYYLASAAPDVLSSISTLFKTGQLSILDPNRVNPYLVQSPQLGQFPRMTLFEPDLRPGYAQSYVLAVESRLTSNLTVDLALLGSLDRHLITTDLINRSESITEQDFLFRRFNKSLPELQYRSSQGISSYSAGAAVVRYRASRATVQASYTLSHTIDNQSDPLLNEFFGLSFTGVSAGQAAATTAAFTRQFDSHGDRANADFDQRHNFVVYGLWDAPAWGSRKVRRFNSGWTISALGALRSGFPYSVTVLASGVPGSGRLYNNPASLVTNASPDIRVPSGPGVLLLDRAAFYAPAEGQVGNTGRNAFRGPGMASLDLSLARSFRVRRLGEAGTVTLRADAFNALNHANLNDPDSLLPSRTFGLATFGRVGKSIGNPAVSPFVETARQILLMLRVQF